MNIKQLASEIAKREGKKSQARIGEIREILSLISDLLYEELSSPDSPSGFTECLYLNGKRRARKTKTKRSTK